MKWVINVDVMDLTAGQVTELMKNIPHTVTVIADDEELMPVAVGGEDVPIAKGEGVFTPSIRKVGMCDE